MFARRIRLTDEEAAEILEQLEGPTTRAGYQLRFAARSLTPSADTTQSEAHRRRVKDSMLREFQRSADGPLPVVEPRMDLDDEQPSHPPVATVVDGLRVDMADLDGVDRAKAMIAAQRAVMIAEQARRKA